MKRITLALATLALATAAFAQSIAVVDMEAVLAKHPNTPNDKKLLESTLADYTKERDALRADLDQKQADIERQVRDAQNPMLAPAKAEELKRACQQAMAALEEAGRAAEAQMAERSRTLSEMERKLIKRSSEEIQAHIAAYAKEKGYDVVVYKNVVPYVNPKHDITDAIIVLCGGTPDKKDTSKASKELAKPATLR